MFEYDKEYAVLFVKATLELAILIISFIDLFILSKLFINSPTSSFLEKYLSLISKVKSPEEIKLATLNASFNGDVNLLVNPTITAVTTAIITKQNKIANNTVLPNEEYNSFSSILIIIYQFVPSIL